LEESVKKAAEEKKINDEKLAKIDNDLKE